MQFDVVQYMGIIFLILSNNLSNFFFSKLDWMFTDFRKHIKSHKVLVCVWQMVDIIWDGMLCVDMGFVPSEYWDSLC